MMKSKKKVYVNGRFLGQQPAGVQRFALQVLLKLSQSNAFDLYLLTTKKTRIPKSVKHINIIKVGFFWGYFWEQVELPAFLFLNRFPLLLNLTNLAPVFYFNKIYSLMDTSFKDVPKSFDWKYRLIYSVLVPICLTTSKKVITISKFSKTRILANYTFLKEKKIIVVYCGIKSFKRFPKSPKENLLLSVASLDSRKNTELLLKAFQLFNKQNEFKYKLILVGKGGNAFNSKITTKDKEDIVFSTDVNDDQLAKLYSKAKLYVNLSKYEGFGLPILEALSLGTPVLCSDITVFKELFSDFVNFTEISTPEKVALKMKLSIETNLIDNEKINMLHKTFNWENTARSIAKMILTEA